MKHRSRTVFKSTNFIIDKRTNSKGRVYYELSLNSYGSIAWDPERFDLVRNIVDPTRNRSGHFGRSWKYPNRAAAERDLMLLELML
jgi:hypothetical protein